MAFLPDLAAAAFYALAAFLVLLGFLVVFVESIGRSRFLAALVGVVILAILLALGGEPGIAMVVVAVGGALVANQAFEWLTTR